MNDKTESKANNILRRLRRDIAIILVIKVIALYFISTMFFSQPPKPDVAAHLLETQYFMDKD